MLLLYMCAGITAQTEDPPITGGTLPAHLIAEFDYPKRWGDEFFVLGGQYDAGAHLWVKVELSYRNDSDERSVTIGYRFGQPVGPAGKLFDTHQTAFLPTAISKAQGRGNKFYVAGWNPRTERVVIEEWSIGVTHVSESALGPSGEYLSPTLQLPAISKVEIFNSPRGASVQPIEGLACNPISQELYALMYGPLGAIYILDITASPPTPSLLTDATHFQGLASASGMRAFLHDDGGLLILTNEDHMWSGSTGDHLVIPDGNLDGQPDTALIEYHTNESLYNAYSADKWRRSWSLP